MIKNTFPEQMNIMSKLDLSDVLEKAFGSPLVPTGHLTDMCGARRGVNAKMKKPQLGWRPCVFCASIVMARGIL